MRTGRNAGLSPWHSCRSLDHWDMRTGRNPGAGLLHGQESLDHWDMRTGRNQEQIDIANGV